MWTQQCQESFEKIKNLLIISLVLKMADPENDFEVCIDVCFKGLGVIVLMQEMHVEAYESQKLKEH